MDHLQGFRRTAYCGDSRLQDVGREVSVCGWVGRLRDLGQLIFIDLRDRSGILQLAFDEQTDRSIFEKAGTVHAEYVLAARGILRERSSKNPDLPTGDVELAVTELRILAKSETPPFEIVENSQTGESTRLKYRYLDLRRPDLQRNLLMRHKMTKITRDYFDEQGFVEIETPMLIKSTPEGARDYLVPSRLHPGSFYALPQSPQLYKQLCMVAGFDRYMQLARCFRDEDLRADRQPEFTQIDLEMSFVDTEDVLAVAEGYVARLFSEVMGEPLTLPLPRLTYQEAMERYGSDKPDTRFGMEIVDISAAVDGCGFSVFTKALSEGGSVRAITAKGCAARLSRKEIDKINEYVRGIGGAGTAWIRLTEEGLSSSFSKFLSESEMAAILEAAKAETGDVVFIIAGALKSVVLSQLGLLRGHVARVLDLIPENSFHFLWVVEFPFFEKNPETGEFEAMHHPFTSPLDECLPYLETDKAAVRAKAYDLVLNGVELASGSIRITEPGLQGQIFRLLGLSEAESQKKFGYLLDAFRYGAPPHGGMAIGLDRLVMQMLGCESLRDVVAFPKLQNATEPMTSCPDSVDSALLEELGLSLKSTEDKGTEGL